MLGSPPWMLACILQASCPTLLPVAAAEMMEPASTSVLTHLPAEHACSEARQQCENPAVLDADEERTRVIPPHFML